MSDVRKVNVSPDVEVHIFPSGHVDIRMYREEEDSWGEVAMLPAEVVPLINALVSALEP